MDKRRRGNLIEDYKIITGKEGVQWERFLVLAQNKAVWGQHRYKLFKEVKGLMAENLYSRSCLDLEWFRLYNKPYEF